MNFNTKENQLDLMIGLLNNPDLPIPSANELIKFYCEEVKRDYPIHKFEFCVVFSFFRVSSNFFFY
jgi:hypothetical protein